MPPIPAHLVKVASANRQLQGSVDQWPTEILHALLSEHPWMRPFEANIHLERLDGQRKVAQGQVLCCPTQMDMDAAREASSLIAFPVIVNGGLIEPFDVYAHNGALHPTSQRNIEDLLVRPDLFTSVVDAVPPTATNLLTQYNQRSRNDWTLNQYGANITVEKVAKVNPYKTLQVPAGVSRALLTHDITKVAWSRMLAFEPAQDPQNARVFQVYVDKDGAHMRGIDREDGSTWSVKLAADSMDAWPDEIFAAVRDQGFYLSTPEPWVHEVVAAETPALVGDQLGEVNKFAYAVVSDGQPHQGILIPEVVSLNGRPIGQLFLSDDGYAFQEKIAAAFIDDATSDLGAAVNTNAAGRGVILYHSHNKAFSTEPVEVLRHEKVASDLFGEPGDIVDVVRLRGLVTGTEIAYVATPGLRKLAHLVGDYWAGPAFGGTLDQSSRTLFLPLPEQQLSLLAGEAIDKLAVDRSAWSRKAPISVYVDKEADVFEIQSNGQTLCALGARDSAFALAGLGLSKVAVEQVLAARWDGGHFFLPGASQEPPTPKVAHANVRPVNLFELVVDLAELGKPMEGLMKTAGRQISSETVDAVLNLGFLTPQNANVYVDYLPALEKAASQLADLVVASRLGLDTIRESAAKNAMSQLQAVIDDLYILRQNVEN